MTMLQHKRAPFKLAEQYHWLVVLCNREHIEEFRRAPDDMLSMPEATQQVRDCPLLVFDRTECRWQRLPVHYTLGHEITDVTYHVANIVSRFTRNTGTLYPEMRDEIVTAFGDVLGLRGHGEDPAVMKVTVY